MTKEKVAHTPGPWYVEPFQDECDGIGVCAFGKGVVADVDSDYCEIDKMRANAHLIAAAPDLLAMCKQAVAMLESMDVDALGEGGTADDSWPLRDEYLHYWRQAIAKAEGK